MLSYPPGEGTGIHPFREAVVLVPVACDGIEGDYVPYIYVTTRRGAGGRPRDRGLAQELADIAFERDGDSFRGRSPAGARRS